GGRGGRRDGVTRESGQAASKGRRAEEWKIRTVRLFRSSTSPLLHSDGTVHLDRHSTQAMQQQPEWHHEFRLLIHERHLDLFGHVNNAASLVIFEEARWDWVTGNGFGVREVRERGLGPVLLEARLRFHREVTNREQVIIRSRTVEYKGKIGRVE